MYFSSITEYIYNLWAYVIDKNKAHIFFGILHAFEFIKSNMFRQRIKYARFKLITNAVNHALYSMIGNTACFSVNDFVAKSITMRFTRFEMKQFSPTIFDFSVK